MMEIMILKCVKHMGLGGRREEGGGRREEGGVTTWTWVNFEVFCTYKYYQNGA